MIFYWNRPIDPPRLDTLIEEVAQWVHRHDLHVPAIMLLEMHKPLTFFIGQSLLFSAPVIAPLFGPQKVQELSCLFESREHVERLIQRIEELASAPNPKASEGEKNASC